MTVCPLIPTDPWRTTIASAVALLSLASCSLLPGSTAPQEVLDRCLATRNINGDQPVGAKLILGDLVQFIASKSDGYRWQRSGVDTGVFRMSRTDKLTGQVHHLAFEVMLEPALPDQNCAQGLATVTSMTADGVALDGYQTEDQVLGVAIAIHNAKPTAPRQLKEQDRAASLPTADNEQMGPGPPPSADGEMTEQEILDDDAAFYAEEARKGRK